MQNANSQLAAAPNSGGMTKDVVDYGALPSSLSHQFRLAFEASTQSFARRAGKLGVRPGCFTLLYLIQRNPGITQTALSRANLRDKSTLTPALRYLEESGLIRREQAMNDRRSYRLHLTPRGEQAASELGKQAEAHETELGRIIGPEQRAEFMAALRRIALALQEEDEAEPQAGPQEG